MQLLLENQQLLPWQNVHHFHHTLPNWYYVVLASHLARVLRPRASALPGHVHRFLEKFFHVFYTTANILGMREELIQYQVRFDVMIILSCSLCIKKQSLYCASSSSNSLWYIYPISRTIRCTFFPEKCDLNLTCVLYAEGKYLFPNLWMSLHLLYDIFIVK